MAIATKTDGGHPVSSRVALPEHCVEAVRKHEEPERGFSRCCPMAAEKTAGMSRSEAEGLQCSGVRSASHTKQRTCSDSMEVDNGPLEDYFALPTGDLHFHVGESEMTSTLFGTSTTTH